MHLNVKNRSRNQLGSGSGLFLSSLFFSLNYCCFPSECVRKVLESVILHFLIAVKRLEKSPETDWFQDFSVMRDQFRYTLKIGKIES